MGLTFPKQEKLKSRKAIKQLFEDGKGISKYPIKLLYLPVENVDYNQAGFAVPKRNFKLAVTRNKLKRLLREAYRLHKTELIEKDGTNFVILFIYVGRTELPFATLEKTMFKLLKKLNNETL
ncbi:ribonuclease P protein component [Patiriisocius marinus]|uniref:Ribonuclease P protein component n=1 Tax=Patiriisocius marinus TaxID=1397112 RepID=A0A5J4IYJ7_9FLAO|nr:ribonuclease P protein component [Patiriisocius marinus]GER58631.1 ribonuclease P protein component [Patiriisocius marinus]